MTARFREPIPEVHNEQRERDQAHDRACFEEHRNLFFVLCALARYRTDEELPLWVREWLLGFALEVLPAFLHRPASSAQPATATRRAMGDRPEHVPTTAKSTRRCSARSAWGKARM